MSDQYMKQFTLTSDEWTLVGEEVRNVAIQFAGLGQCQVHFGPEEPTPSDTYFTIAKGISEEPSTMSLGQIPDGAQVWLRASGSRSSVRVTVLAY